MKKLADKLSNGNIVKLDDNGTDVTGNISGCTVSDTGNTDALIFNGTGVYHWYPLRDKDKFTMQMK